MENLSKKTQTGSAVAVLVFAVKQAICFLTAFILSYTRLFECLPSLSIAFSASVPKKYIVAAVIGGVTGSAAFSDNMLIGISGAACMITTGIINAAVRSAFSKREVPFISFVSAMLCCTSAGITVLISNGFYFSGLLLFVCDGILSGGAAYFYTRSLTVLPMIKKKSLFGSAEIVCLLVSFCAVIMSLSRFSVFMLVPSRTVAFLLVLLIAYIFGETAACSAGILCGAALEVSTAVGGLSCCVSLCGLIAGFFVKRGRIFGVLSVILTSGMFAVVSGTAESGAVFFESVIAAGIFYLIPKKFLISLKRRYGLKSVVTDSYSQRQTERLGAAARAVSDISPCIERLKKHESGVRNSSKIKASSFVKETVCADCGMNNSCWGDGQAETTALFKETVGFVEKNGTVTPDELPKELSKKCIRRNMLSAAFIQAHMEYCLNRDIRKKDDRFSDASLILSDFAKALSSPRKNYPKIASCAEEVFRSFGIETNEAVCTGESGRTVLYIRINAFDGSVNKTLLAKEISELCGCQFDIPSVSRDGNEFILTFTQTPLLKLRTGTVQYAADRSGICGDFFITFKEEGKQYFVLSDGMGTGEQAASDSEAAAEIFASLVRAGMSFHCALKTVNTALLKREDIESVSTLDVVCVDLYSGETVFLKAGAAPSYILTDGKVVRVEMPSMPIGILDGVSFAKKEMVLSKGDTVLMVSDGACALKDDHIVKILSGFKGGSAQELAEKVLKASGKKSDDSTILAIVF